VSMLAQHCDPPQQTFHYWEHPCYCQSHCMLFQTYAVYCRSVFFFPMLKSFLEFTINYDNTSSQVKYFPICFSVECTILITVVSWCCH
jgi:hypothetical protein